MEVLSEQSQEFKNPQTYSLEAAFFAQKEAFAKQPYPSLSQRLQHLKLLKKMLLSHQRQIVEAIHQDFGGRAEPETKMAEILPTIEEINHSIEHLKDWMRAEPKKVGLAFQPAKAKMLYQPLGVVGIIVPWNYPLYLAMGPMIGALAAGNRVMIKMSEDSPALTELLQKCFAEVYSGNHVYVTGGDAKVAESFAKLAFDHLLFTGSTSVGRLVMKAASASLTPVTLELGGKSPCIVTSHFSVKAAAKRILFGKCLNAGQTCVAPDYVLCEAEVFDEFVSELSAGFQKMFPDYETSPDYTSIINQRQFDRLSAYLAEAREKGAQVLPLAGWTEAAKEKRRLPLHLLLEPQEELRVMKEEIFGSILPILKIKNLSEAIEYINARPRPLALYLFDQRAKSQRRVEEETHSGGVGINECLMQVSQPELAFGGVGASGMGRYHGVEGFKTFSNAKAIFEKGRVSTSSLAYPPYHSGRLGLLYRFFMR